MNIAFFITSHGFGHAARSSAIIAAMNEKIENLHFELFTETPSWFFENSYLTNFGYHSIKNDIGLVQKTPIHEDLEKTIEALDQFYPLDEDLINQTSEQLKQNQCKLVLCDISPLGIAAAKRAGIPSILIENFTWDWIYEGYSEQQSRLSLYINYLKELFEAVDFRIQTEPICSPGKADCAVPPISRKHRQSKNSLQSSLGIVGDKPVVMISLGGIPVVYPFIEQLKDFQEFHFLLPGGTESLKFNQNLTLFPFKSDLYHPDLVHASDVLIGKVGYSTLAEVYGEGIPFGYIERPHFRESKIMSKFIQKRMSGFSISEVEFMNGNWLANLKKNIQKTTKRKNLNPNGANVVAEFCCKLLTTL